MSFFRPFALERYFAAHEFSARYLLCASDCETLTVRDLLSLEEGAAESLLSLGLGYTETRGAPALREAVAAHYPGLSPQGVFIHAGAEEAILNLCLAILEKGDRVIVNFPCYQSLSEIPRALGCRVDALRLREDPEGWRIDPDELDRLLEKGGHAKLLVLNMPHNPTGALCRPEEFRRIVESCRRTGTILLVDEVYRYLERDPERRLPTACECYELGISLNVLSKSAGLAGLRIGWLATRMAEVLDKVAVVKDYNSICSSGPSEVLAGIAARNLRGLAERNRERCLANLDSLVSFFARHPEVFAWTEPEGGSIGFAHLAPEEAARFPGAKGKGDAEAFALAALEGSGVLLLPGAYYGYNPAYFRVGFGRANLPEALDRLEDWLKTRR